MLAALANPRRRCRRILVGEDARREVAGRIADLAMTQPDVPVLETVPRARIERTLPPGAVHQSVALLADPLPEVPLGELCRELAALGAATVVLLDRVTDPHNVGAVVRSAAAFGAHAVILPERHAPEVTGVLAKAASGGLEAVPLLHVTNLARALATLKKAGFWCVGLDAAAGRTLAEAGLPARVALVLGAEGAGMRRLTRESCDLLVRIPVSESVGSLNVSSAAAVALYELARAR